jgi:dTDP-D-glucose 4,6-dehydratase
LFAELGWRPSVTLEQGLALTVDWYRRQVRGMQTATSGPPEITVEIN